MTEHILKAKASFEVEDFSEQAGMVSLYVCEQCEIEVLYTYIDSGVTPYKITCVYCQGVMRAKDKEEVCQPDRIWYRPANVFELERLAMAAYSAGCRDGLYKDEDGRNMIATILEDFIKHYNNGGLFAKLFKEKNNGRTAF